MAYGVNNVGGFMSSKSRKWAERVRYNHEKRGYVFEDEVTIPALNQLMKQSLNTPCVYCGRNLDFENEEKYLPSLDIINPKLPVTLGNIQIICRNCNSLKGRMSHTKFLLYRKTPEYLLKAKVPEGVIPNKISGRIY